MVDLLALARAAVDDPSARPVLEDAVRESGWWDERIRFPLSTPRTTHEDREEILALLHWPGEIGADSARTIVQALESPPRVPSMLGPTLVAAACICFHGKGGMLMVPRLPACPVHGVRAAMPRADDKRGGT